VVTLLVANRARQLPVDLIPIGESYAMDDNDAPDSSSDPNWSSEGVADSRAGTLTLSAIGCGVSENIYSYSGLYKRQARVRVSCTAAFVITHVGYDFNGQSGQLLAHYNQAGPVVRGKSGNPLGYTTEKTKTYPGANGRVYSVTVCVEIAGWLYYTGIGRGCMTMQRLP
jgi:hypothetical protein